MTGISEFIIIVLFPSLKTKDEYSYFLGIYRKYFRFAFGAI